MNIKFEDQKYMQKALKLAAQGLGRTSPNPVVGALIVKDGEILGQGFHHKAGTPHAEINALGSAGSHDVSGSTMYVTLEPCSHQGRTPPCAPALVKAGIKRVVVATLDSNPQVAGQGIKILEDAGIETVVGVLQEEATRINEIFFKYIQNRQPFVCLKAAMTLDGKIASFSGDSRWITGESSRSFVHQLRNTYDAIMVGIGTVLADDPMLNTRLEIEDRRNPVRVIIDGNLDMPLDSNIVQTSGEQRTIVFTSEANDKSKAKLLQSLGLEIIEMEGESSRLPLEKALKVLGEMGICSILLEGGAEVNAYMLEHGLVDKVHWFIAPKIIGGRTSPSPVGGKGIQYMNEALNLKDIEIMHFDNDICITGYLKGENQKISQGLI
ncbi:MAG: bifunctional diaminohydroxyphosphoribosylaminopyrimidine deaminase/5-amino-6-(5-phosphoribosylamino)uracil reductase RibD [Syntrophomonas sp.]